MLELLTQIRERIAALRDEQQRVIKEGEATLHQLTGGIAELEALAQQISKDVQAKVDA